MADYRLWDRANRLGSWAVALVAIEAVGVYTVCGPNIQHHEDMALPCPYGENTISPDRDRMSAGYSGTPLVKKLGLKPGCRALVLNVPANYAETLGELPPGVTLESAIDGQFDFIQFFATRRADLEAHFPALRAALKPDGMLWVSWPKKAAKIPHRSHRRCPAGRHPAAGSGRCQSCSSG